MDSIELMEKTFNPALRLREKKPGVPEIFGSLEYALLLLQRGGADDCRRANEIVAALLDWQLKEPDWERGRFPSWWPEEGWRDANSNLFMAPGLLEIESRHLDKLSPAVAGRFPEAVRLAMAMADRRWEEEIFDLHRDGAAYSNIMALYIQFLFLAGARYRDERRLRAARAQWRRWLNRISYYGLEEFVSTTYHEVILEVLLRLRRTVAEPRICREMDLVLDHLMMLQYAIAHPVLRLPVCGSARDYRHNLRAGEGGFPFPAAAAGKDDYRTPAPLLAEYARRSFPHEVRGRATPVPFRFCAWQTGQAALGTMTGGLYFTQQINLLAAVGRSPRERAVACLPCGIAWNTCNGYASQRAHRALCLFTRCANTYFRTQTITPDRDLPDAYSRQHGLGLTGEWRELENRAGRLAVTAFDHTLVLQPFALREGRAEPLRLEPRKIATWYAPEEYRNYLFPDDERMFGCTAMLVPNGQAPEEMPIQAMQSDREIMVSASDLSLRLFRQMSGELTELYADDWRTAPLLTCPAGTLWPGELTRRAANPEPEPR